jgi:galactose-1-phosphate uridylyltransferase
MIISKRHLTKITDFTKIEVAAFAIILKQLTIKYDNLLRPHFPIRLEFTLQLMVRNIRNGSFTCIFTPHYYVLQP